MKISRGWTIAIAALVLLNAPNPARADETKLIFVTVVPPGTVVDSQVILPWARRVNEHGKGVLSIDVREGPALGNFSNIYDRVLDDAIQIGWEIQAAVGGKFPLSNVVALPFIFDNGADASTAFWRVYQSGAMSSEYDKVVPLMLVALPQTSIHLAKPPQSLETLAGLKLIVVGKVQGEAVSNLGGTPISLQLTETYEAIQRHTVDGTMIAWVGFNPWKLAEVTTYHIDAALGGSAGMIFMSKAKYDALPAAARKILADNSGEMQSRAFGQALDIGNEEQRASVKASDKQTVATLSPTQLASWQTKIAPAIDQWVKDNKGADIVLSRFRSALADAKAGK